MEKFTISFERRQALGFHLYRKREIKELTIDELSVITGINSAEIAALERGETEVVNPFLLVALGEALGVHHMMLYILAGYIDDVELAGILFKNRMLIDN